MIRRKFITLIGGAAAVRCARETLTLGRVNQKLFKGMSNNDLNRLQSVPKIS
jgi:hypothetical protein